MTVKVQFSCVEPILLRLPKLSVDCKYSMIYLRRLVKIHAFAHLLQHLTIDDRKLRLLPAIGNKAVNDLLRSDWMKYMNTSLDLREPGILA